MPGERGWGQVPLPWDLGALALLEVWATHQADGLVANGVAMPFDAIQVESALLSPPISLPPFCIHAFTSPWLFHPFSPLFCHLLSFFFGLLMPLCITLFHGGCGCSCFLVPQVAGLRKVKMAPRALNSFVPGAETTWKLGVPSHAILH